MSPEKESTENTENTIRKTALAAMAISLIATALLVAETENQSYSALYLKPGSYQSYINGSRISFTYGAQSYENGPTDYDLKVFLGKNQAMEKRFTLRESEKLEETLSYDLPKNAAMPLKVTILMSNGNENYETHYWIKGKQ